MSPITTLLLFEAARKCDEEMSGALSSSYYVNIHKEPSKYDLFMKKHKILDTMIPYVVGVVLGLLPIIISAILWKIAGLW